MSKHNIPFQYKKRKHPKLSQICSYGIFFKGLKNKSRKENPQKLTQLSSRSHQRHLVGKRTAQKDTIIDITSDSQVNSNFPNRWSPASLTAETVRNSRGKQAISVRTTEVLLYIW